MSSEARMEQPAAALLIGQVTDPLVAPLQRAQAAGWRFIRKADVYTAASHLLRPRESVPAAVVVLVESLRGDELRFGDFLARRLPAVPAVAVYAASAEDRRLEACRRRNVTVLSAADLAAWLAGHHPAATGPTGATADAGATGDVPTVGATGGLPASASDSVQPDKSLPPHAVQGPDPVSPGTEVDLDIPDELADLPDLNEMQVELAGPTEYSEDDLPALPEESDIHAEPVRPDPDEPDEDELPAESEEQDEEQEEDLPNHVPLTPWSSQPRPARRPPRRPPPAQTPSELPRVTPSVPAQPETRNSESETRSSRPQPAARPRPARDWEHGLLTPDELRALLQDPDEGQGEARP